MRDSVPLAEGEKGPARRDSAAAWLIPRRTFALPNPPSSAFAQIRSSSPRFGLPTNPFGAPALTTAASRSGLRWYGLLLSGEGRQEQRGRQQMAAITHGDGDQGKLDEPVTPKGKLVLEVSG